jgi:pSer/pThr/pTyr-binding forkhead associated (FHA) protein
MDAALNAKDRNELSELFIDLSTQTRRKAWERLRDRFTLLRMAVTGRPDPSTRLLRAPKVKLTALQATLPPLPLPPQADRRFTIGRAMACDFTLADLSVSRWHARLYRDEEHWLLSDLGSTNGTRLNGWRVTTGVPIKPGDQVSFGSISFVITDRAPGLP